MNFHEPLDSALARRLIRVEDTEGKPVAGRIALDDHERQWRFSPDRAWRRGRYSIFVPATIEDLAGNNVGKPFDLDLAEGPRLQKTPTVIRLPFEVR